MPERFLPTDEQHAFIGEPSDEIVLVACPGSGKTDSGIKRFVDRCASDPLRGHAYLSYTNVAVDESYKRVRAMGDDDAVGYPNLISTIDGFFRTNVFDPFITAVLPGAPKEVQILSERPPYPPELSTDKAFEVSGVRRPLPGKQYGRPLKAWEAHRVLNSDGTVGFRYRNDADEWTPVDGKYSKAIVTAKVAYVERGFATFNDVLALSRTLLQREELRIAEIVSARFREIMVDEAQDTSALQQSMLAMLAAHGSKISYVGDPKQGIYVFSGANPKYLDTLVASGHRPLELTRNFRSVQEIVTVVNSHFGTAMRTQRVTPPQCGAYVIVAGWEVAVSRFEALLSSCDIAPAAAALLVRSRGDLGNVLRPVSMDGWSMAPRQALTAWRNERRGNFEGASEAAGRLLRAIVDPSWEGFQNRNEYARFAWTCLRAYCPPPAEKETPQQWGDRLKNSLEQFMTDTGLPKHKTFGNRASTSKLPSKGDAKMKYSFAPLPIRATVVHQVKGETIRAVLLVAPADQHATWLAHEDTEESNICYVAFTRAADVLVVQCDDEQLAGEWHKRGFVYLK